MVGVADLATEHAAGSVVVSSPLGLAADRPSSLGEIAITIGKAFIPFSSFKGQLARTKSACNPQ